MITSCRLCGGESLTEKISLGDQFINDFPASLPPQVPIVPIALVQCDACGMLQAKHDAPNRLLYERKYWFRSGTNPVIRKNLEEIANLAVSHMKENDIIVDIGANDGTLLSYIPSVFYRVGIEPASNLIEDLGKHCNEFVENFWTEYPGAKVITAIGMFYDTPDPMKFVAGVKSSLKEDGIFITELMTAKTMEESNDIGTLCHEHLMHHTWETFKKLFKDCGLEIYRVERNPLTEDGKGYRIFARHWKTGHVDFEEKPLNLAKFWKNVQKNKENLVNFIREKKKEGKKVYIYGASTKGNLLVQFYGLGPEDIDGAIDKNPEKIGKFMLTGIPIVDESYVKDADYLWCVPYPFLKEFAKKEKEFKGKWIVSMPKFKVK